MKNQGFLGFITFFSCGHGVIRCSHVKSKSGKNPKAKHTWPLYLVNTHRSDFNRPVHLL